MLYDMMKADIVQHLREQQQIGMLGGRCHRAAGIRRDV